MENTVEVLRGLTEKTTATTYDLFFAERRLVVAVVLQPSELIGMYKPDPVSFFFGGAFKSAAIKMRSRTLVEQRRLVFKNKSLDEILAMDNANIEIEYENIDSIRIKKRLLSTHLEITVNNHHQKKIVLSLERSQASEAEKLTNRIFPSNVLKGL